MIVQFCSILLTSSTVTVQYGLLGIIEFKLNNSQKNLFSQKFSTYMYMHVVSVWWGDGLEADISHIQCGYLLEEIVNYYKCVFG